MLKEEIENMLLWVKSYVEKAQTKGVVIGNSGGKDSATCIAIAQKALGKENVLTVFLPCGSSSKDREDAKKVAQIFKVRYIEIELLSAYQEIEESLSQGLTNKLNKETKINLKPRLRMLTLYAMAQNLNYLVMGTGNLCEREIGYTTKWGDNACDFNPIGNFTVEEVIQIGSYLGVPQEILEKAPSDGLSGITDEEKIGIKYEDIGKLIRTGKLENKEIEKQIQKRKEGALHKNRLIPMYFPKSLKNYLEN